MSKGIAIPFRVASDGGIALVERDENADKIIRLALSDNDNDHAFQQDIGLGIKHVFSVSSHAFRGLVVQRINTIFREFETLKQYRLVRGSIRWEKGPSAGEQSLSFQYINLESDEPTSFSLTYKPAGG